MKKCICILLALLLVVGCVFAGCSQEPETKKDNKVEKPEIPAGYTEYKKDKISFAYPEEWQVQDGSVVVLTGDNGNNVTVSYEPKTDMYEKMTVESFNSTMKPLYETMGLTITSVEIGKETTNGLSVVKISQGVEAANGVSMQQTQYVFNAGENTYAVSVTEVVPDAQLVATVLNTLYVKK